ncbi:MAG: hypothetical protein RLZZ511_3926 [Cyanobacteriota bacterium]|jgi:hypothetical protein
MNGWWTQVAGWIPALILPLATVTQIAKILREKSVRGVSALTWMLFGVANIGLYLFTEKYWALQSLIGLLGTALLDFTIVGLVYFYRTHDRAASRRSP